MTEEVDVGHSNLFRANPRLEAVTETLAVKWENIDIQCCITSGQHSKKQQAENVSVGCGLLVGRYEHV